MTVTRTVPAPEPPPCDHALPASATPDTQRLRSQRWPQEPASTLEHPGKSCLVWAGRPLCRSPRAGLTSRPAESRSQRCLPLPLSDHPPPKATRWSHRNASADAAGSSSTATHRCTPSRSPSGGRVPPAGKSCSAIDKKTRSRDQAVGRARVESPMQRCGDASGSTTGWFACTSDEVGVDQRSHSSSSVREKNRERLFVRKPQLAWQRSRDTDVPGRQLRVPAWRGVNLDVVNTCDHTIADRCQTRIVAHHRTCVRGFGQVSIDASGATMRL